MNRRKSQAWAQADFQNGEQFKIYLKWENGEYYFVASAGPNPEKNSSIEFDSTLEWTNQKS